MRTQAENLLVLPPRQFLTTLWQGEVCTPGAYGAGYGGNYIALAITDIPLDPAATYTFTLTPYVTYHGGETVFSETSHRLL